MSSKILMDSQLLRSLLGPAAQRKKASKEATAELVNSILLEETGSPLRSLKRTEKRKKKRRKTRRSNFDEGVAGLGLDRAQARILASNNIFEYAYILGIPREEVDVLERYFRDCSLQAKALEASLCNVNMQLTGGANVISEQDLDLLLTYTGLPQAEVSTAVYNKLLSHSQRSVGENDEAVGGNSSQVKFSGVTSIAKNISLKASMAHILGERFGSEFGSSVAVSSHPDHFSVQIGSYTEVSYTSGGSSTIPIKMHRPSSNPEMSQMSEMSSILHSQSARALPPIRIRKSMSGRPSRPKKRLLDAAGFDEALGRETPRLLHYNNNDCAHDPAQQVEALRRELQVSKAGLNQLSKMVDTNIAWVQQNCDMAPWASSISLRAKRKCRLMAAERIFKVFNGYMFNTLLWAVKQWKVGLQLDHFQGVIRKYCKAKSVISITKNLSAWRLRFIYHRWAAWISFVKAQLRAEREAACIEIQRVARGCLGRRRVHAVKLGKAATNIQLIFRQIHARHVVTKKKENLKVKISDEAAVVIQRKLQEIMMIKQAKAELERRKAQRSAIRIQKIFRGQQGRESFLRRQTQEKEHIAQQEAVILAAVAVEDCAAAAAAAAAVATLEPKELGTDLDALATLDPLAAPTPQIPDKPVGNATISSVHSPEPSAPSPVDESDHKHKVKPQVSHTKAGGKKDPNEKKKPAARTAKRPAKHVEPVQHAATTIQKVARGKLSRVKSIKESPSATSPSTSGCAEVIATEMDPPAAADLGDSLPPAEAQNTVNALSLPETTVADQVAVAVGPAPSVDQPMEALSSESEQVVDGQNVVQEDANVEEAVVQISVEVEPSVKDAIVEEDDDAISVLTTSVAEPRESRPASAQSTSSKSSPGKRGLFNISVPAIGISGSFFKNPFGSFSKKSDHVPTPTLASKSEERVVEFADLPFVEEVDLAAKPAFDERSVPSIPEAPVGDPSLPLDEFESGHHHRSVPNSVPSPRELEVEISQADAHEEVIQAELVHDNRESVPDQTAANDRVEEEKTHEAIEEKATARSKKAPEKKPSGSAADKKKGADRKPAAAVAKEADKLKSRDPKDSKSQGKESQKPATHGKKKTEVLKKDSRSLKATDGTAERPSSAGKVLEVQVEAEAVVDHPSVEVIEAPTFADAPASHDAYALQELPEEPEASGNDLASATSQTSVLSHEDAALRVQQLARSRLAKKKIEERKHAVAKAQQEATEALEWATVTIQTAMRGKLGREKFKVAYQKKQVDTEKKKQSSAAKIQARVRGGKARKRVTGIRAVRDEEDQQIEWLKSFQKKDPNEHELLPAAIPEETEEEKAEEEQPANIVATDAFPGTRLSGSKKVRPPSSSLARPGSSGGNRSRPHTPPTPTTAPRLPTLQKTPRSQKSDAESKSDHTHIHSGPHHPPTTGHPQGVLVTPPPPEVKMVAQDPRLDTLEQRLKQLEEVERRIKESEQNLVEEAKKAESRIKAQMELLEEKAKKAEADRAAQEELMKLAVGSMSHRSPFNTNGLRSARPHATGGHMHATGGRMLASNGMFMTTRGSAPPTARSAKSGPLPTDAPRLSYNGQEWVQLWDDDQQAYYWWCPATQVAQWEQPGMEYPQEYFAGAGAGAGAGESHEQGADESGYESSGGALTDYSTDHETSYLSESEGGAADDWQEYWDEQAQAKYWYNNATGEASWTRPEHLDSQTTSRAMTAASYTGDPLPVVPAQGQGQEGQDAHGWISYIDEETGQLYWHNVATGEVRWDY